jgi:transketolase
MALEGLRPIVSTIATFLTRRCFEQVLIDAALHELPIVLLGTGPGLAYSALGPTHCSVDDFALLRTIPGMDVVAPASTPEANELLIDAVGRGRLAYLRVPRGDEPLLPPNDVPARVGLPVAIRAPGDVAIVSTGAMTARALQAAELLDRQGLSAGVVHVRTVKPLDGSVLLPLLADVESIVTVEEHLRAGGLGTAIVELLCDAGLRPAVSRLGLPDGFVSGYGSHAEALDAAGLTADAIASAACARVGHATLH